MKNDSTQSGFAVAIAMVIVVILAGIYLVMTKMSENHYRRASYDLWQDALDQLQLYYEKNIDCNLTKAANGTSCTAGAPLIIISKRLDESTVDPNDSLTLIKNDWSDLTEVGKYEVRARCKPGTSDQILVEARPKGGINHPLRKKTWTAWTDVYRGKSNIHICKL